jgi:hypothetical protein
MRESDFKVRYYYLFIYYYYYYYLNLNNASYYRKDLGIEYVKVGHWLGTHSLQHGHQTNMGIEHDNLYMVSISVCDCLFV